MKGTIERRRADGMVEVIEYRADFDHEYPVMGTPVHDTIQLKRIDAHTRRRRCCPMPDAYSAPHGASSHRTGAR